MLLANELFSIYNGLTVLALAYATLALTFFVSKAADTEAVSIDGLA